MKYTIIRNQNFFPAFGLMILIAATGLPARAAEEFKFTVGYDYTSGRYNQNVNTEIEKVPVTLNNLTGPWSLKLTVPYIRVTGNGKVIPGPGGPVGGIGFGSTVTNAGLGDVEASVGYALFPANGSFYEVTAKVKFGTADANRGLGTGENDYFLQFDGVLGSNAVSPFFTLGYIFTGDTASYTLKNVPYGTLGLMFKSGRSGNFGLSYEYRQAVTSGVDDLQLVNIFTSWNDSAGWATTLSALVGFTDSSPEYGVSLMFTRTD